MPEGHKSLLMSNVATAVGGRNSQFCAAGNAATDLSLLWSKATSNRWPNVASVSILMVKGHKTDCSLMLLQSRVFSSRGLHV